MTKFYNPYQFIEFTGKVNGKNVKTTPFSDIRTGKTHARHDYWLPSSQHHNGRILCQIDLITPTLTGNIHDTETKAPASIVKQYQYQKQLGIQANSLRGMLASILETLSQSALRSLSDKTYRVSDQGKAFTFKDSTFDFFTDHGQAGNKNYQNALPWGNGRTDLTPAETLLGVVKDVKEEIDPTDKHPASENLASRIRFADALGENITLSHELLPLKILGSPKPSESGSKIEKNKGTPVACMYFKPRGASGYIAKTALAKVLHEANGRKFYLPHPENSPAHWQAPLPGKDPHAKQRVYAKPLAAGQTLFFHIDFSNLSTDELVLLQTCLQPSPHHQHSLGLGKALGLGQIKLTPLATFFIDRTQRYSRQAFTTNRYTAVQSSVTTLPEWLQQRYPHECLAINTAPNITLANTSQLIDNETLTALQRLGNPKQQQPGIAICFPYHEGSGQKPHNEEESFKWFVENNSGKYTAQYLLTLNATQELPALNSVHQRLNQKASTTTQAKQQIESGRLLLNNLPDCQTTQEREAIALEIRNHFAEFTIIRVHLPEPADKQAFIELAKNDLEQAFKTSTAYPLKINNQRINLFITKP